MRCWPTFRLMSHDKPRRVLIIGGGDGGVLRECLKHPSVTKAVVVESDRAVIDAAQKYFPETPGGAFDDVRTEVVLADSLNYLSGVQEPFDVIIVECSWHPRIARGPLCTLSFRLPAAARSTATACWQSGAACRSSFPIT